MRTYQRNPWFSPPALQYVARFTGNPPGYGSSMLGYDSYEPPPGHRVFHNPGFRAGQRVTWSEEALEMEIGRRGQVMRVRYPGRHRDDADRTSIEFDSGRSRMVNNWEIVPAIGAPVQQNPWFSPPALQYVARFTGNPPGYGSSMLDYDSYEPPPGHEVFHNPGFPRCDEHAWADETDDQWSREQNPRQDVLCQCGWGRLGMEESEIPDRCPVCEHAIGICEACGERKSDCECDGYGHGGYGHGHGPGRHPLIDHYRAQGMRDAEDPDYDSYPNPSVRSNACYGIHFHQDRPFDARGVFAAAQQLPSMPKSHRGHIVPGGNPGETITIRDREVPVDHSAKGKYHHVRMAEPNEFKAIRTKTLSAKKGIKARVGIFKGRGPRGGRSEIQSYLFDAAIYTPQDVVRWIEGHRTPAPLRMEISSAAPSRRRMKVYGEASEAPRKKRKSVKAKVKRKPRKVPADAKRCKAKGKKGRCKGYRQAGKTQCALHAAGVAGKRQPKKSSRKKRRVG